LAKPTPEVYTGGVASAGGAWRKLTHPLCGYLAFTPYRGRPRSTPEVYTYPYGVRGVASAKAKPLWG
jgi:hypothetical protein